MPRVSSCWRLASLPRFRAKRVALVIQQPCGRFLPPIQRHLDRPWAREHVRVLDGRFALNEIRSCQGVALDDVQRFAVIIAGSIEAGLIQ